MNDQILSVLVSNHFGVLTRVTNLFSRRGFNIRELTVGETDDPEISRITILTGGDETALDQIQKQLRKLEDVKKVILLPNEKTIGRELLLIKIDLKNDHFSEIKNLIDLIKGHVLSSDENSLIVEIVEDMKNIDQFISQMKEYGIMEMCRTGVTALQRGKLTIYDF